MVYINKKIAAISILFLFFLGSGHGFSNQYVKKHFSEAVYRLYKSIEMSREQKERSLRTINETVSHVDLNVQLGSLSPRSFLGLALRKADRDILEILLRAGADPNKKYGYFTPIQVAVDTKRYNSALIMYRYGGTLETAKRFKKLFHAAVEAGDKKTVFSLLDKEQIYKNVFLGMAYSSLKTAVEKGDYLMVKGLRERGFNVSGHQGDLLLHTLYAKKRWNSANQQNVAPENYDKTFHILLNGGAELTAKAARLYSRVKYMHTGLIGRWKTPTLSGVDFFITLVLVLLSFSAFWAFPYVYKKICFVVFMSVAITTVVVLAIEGVCFFFPSLYVRFAVSRLVTFVYLTHRIMLMAAALPSLAFVVFAIATGSTEKTCGHCHASVSFFDRAGKTCPHCGVLWQDEKNIVVEK